MHRHILCDVCSKHTFVFVPPESCWWSDLETWSCSCLASVRLPSLVPLPNKTIPALQHWPYNKARVCKCYPGSAVDPPTCAWLAEGSPRWWVPPWRNPPSEAAAWKRTQKGGIQAQGLRDVILVFDHTFLSLARQELCVHWPPVPLTGLPK